MIDVAIMDAGPIFSIGAARLISSTSDMRLVPRSAGGGAGPAVPADVYLLDPHAVTRMTPQALVAALAAVAPVLLVMWSPTSSGMADSLIEAGAHGVIDHQASPEALLDALRTAVVEAKSPRSAPVRGRCGPATEESASLSQREEQVLHLISRGMTHHQTATSLGISPHTVDTYVKRIRAKLRLGNKAELARVAILRSMHAVNPPMKQG